MMVASWHSATLPPDHASVPAMVGGRWHDPSATSVWPGLHTLQLVQSQPCTAKQLLAASEGGGDRMGGGRQDAWEEGGCE